MTKTDYSSILSAANSLSSADKLRLIEALSDTIVRPSAQILLSDSQRKELDRRIAEADASPDNVIPWEQVKAELLSRAKTT